MEILEPDFENSVSADIDEDTHDVIIGSQKISPVDILRSDPGAYSEEFNQWLEKWIRDRLSIKDKILEFYPPNRARYDALCTLVKSNAMVPFIGAGMSIPTGMPSWTAFLKDLCMQTLMDHEEVNKHLESGKYPQAATLLFEHMPRNLFDERVKNTFRLLKDQEIQGPIRLLPKIFHSTVITTNFDDVLEILYQNQSQRFDHIFCGPDINEYREYRDTKRCLLQIHGDNSLTKPKVLTVADYETFYSDESQAKIELELIFRTHPLLFLGCSLRHDYTLETLKKVSDGDRNSPQHFTFLLKPMDETERVKQEHFLTERKIFPIWYESNHNLSIEALLAGLMREMSII